MAWYSEPNDDKDPAKLQALLTALVAAMDDPDTTPPVRAALSNLKNYLDPAQ